MVVGVGERIGRQGGGQMDQAGQQVEVGLLAGGRLGFGERGLTEDVHREGQAAAAQGPHRIQRLRQVAAGDEFTGHPGAGPLGDLVKQGSQRA